MSNKITYYEVGAYERYENDNVIKCFQSQEKAEAFYNSLQSRKQEFISELMKYPLKARDLDIYTDEGDYKWGDAFEDIASRILLACIDYVERLKKGYEDADECLHYADFYMSEQTIEFAD